MIRFTATSHPACPDCEHGALKTDADFERNHCDACELTLNGSGLPPAYAQPYPYRTEANGYGEGLYDDD